MKATIYYKYVDFDVEYDYYPEEKDVLIGYNQGQPGCPASMEITSIKHKGTDFTEVLWDSMDRIEGLILEQMRQEAEYYNER